AARSRHQGAAGGDLHRHRHHAAAQEGPAERLDARPPALHRVRPRQAAGRAGLHASLRAGAGGPGHARELVLAALDARRHRGHAGRLHRGRRRDGSGGRRHLRRHPLRPADEARRFGAGHGRRGARRGGRRRHGHAGLEPGRRGAAFRRRPHLRRLAGAGGLRRRRRVPGRRGRGGRRRRGVHPRGAGGRGGERGRGAGAAGGVDPGPRRGGRGAARPLPAERREQGALRGGEEAV
ncbi:MAG: Demethylmenaquinone methyltransferase-like protein, partial [uncultured Acetobacteraceae bacterium]